jgi:hypothetical protein
MHINIRFGAPSTLRSWLQQWLLHAHSPNDILLLAAGAVVLP